MVGTMSLALFCTSENVLGGRHRGEAELFGPQLHYVYVESHLRRYHTLLGQLENWGLQQLGQTASVPA